MWVGGWVSLCGWLHTKRVYYSAVSHLSTDWAQCRETADVHNAFPVGQTAMLMITNGENQQWQRHRPYPHVVVGSCGVGRPQTELVTLRPQINYRSTYLVTEVLKCFTNEAQQLQTPNVTSCDICTVLTHFHHHWLVIQGSKKVKVKASHTRLRALGPELIPVYRQSACRWP